MNFLAAPELRQRATWKFNRLTIALWSAWLTAVLWVRHLAEGIVRLPRVARRQVTPVRLALGLGVTGLVVTPTVLYQVERHDHLDVQRAYRELEISSAVESRYLESTVRDLRDEQNRLANLVLESGNTLYASNRVYVKVLATGYSSTIAQTDSTPFVTAANTPSRPGVVAVSQNLLREYTPGAPFSFGDRIKIYGVGDFIIEDCMNPRWTNRVDIWFATREEALRFGLREVVLSGALDRGIDVREEILSGNYTAEDFADGL